MDMRVDTTRLDEGWLVRLRVVLDRRETSELFLAGDALISWPTDGMVSSGGPSPFERSSMFLSEIVSRPDGLALMYESEALAERAAKILAYQARAAVPSE